MFSKHAASLPRLGRLAGRGAMRMLPTTARSQTELLTPAQVEQFHTDGFVRIKCVLSEAEISDFEKVGSVCLRAGCMVPFVHANSLGAFRGAEPAHIALESCSAALLARQLTCALVPLLTGQIYLRFLAKDIPVPSSDYGAPKGMRFCSTRPTQYSVCLSLSLSLSLSLLMGLTRHLSSSPPQLQETLFPSRTASDAAGDMSQPMSTPQEQFNMINVMIPRYYHPKMQVRAFV
jgi:hypothetical protein